MRWCWLFHKWSNWTQHTVKYIDPKSGKEYVGETQRKICEVCGYVVEEEV